MAFDYRMLSLFRAATFRTAKFLEPSMTRGIPDKVIPDIDFIDGAAVQCSSCKDTFLGAGNLQMITNKF